MRIRQEAGENADIMFREQGVGGSNPLAPTNKIKDLDRHQQSPRNRFANNLLTKSPPMSARASLPHGAASWPHVR